MQVRGKRRIWGKLALELLTAAGVLALAAGPVVRADDDDCQKRVVRIDHELHRAAERHGWDSPEVQAKRAELATAREWCWNHGHRWWDEHEKRWHTDHDWDEHDHDHPHDQDRPH